MPNPSAYAFGRVSSAAKRVAWDWIKGHAQGPRWRNGQARDLARANCRLTEMNKDEEYIAMRKERMQLLKDRNDFRDGQRNATACDLLDIELRPTLMTRRCRCWRA